MTSWSLRFDLETMSMLCGSECMFVVVAGKVNAHRSTAVWGEADAEVDSGEPALAESAYGQRDQSTLRLHCIAADV